MQPPCRRCERKGCGAYHDECVPFQEYCKQRDQNIKDAIARSDLNDFSKMHSVRMKRGRKR